jgi:hypothetical protein
MGNFAKSDQRELIWFTPLVNGFEFDIKATLEDVTSKIFQLTLSTCIKRLQISLLKISNILLIEFSLG